jgi:hypothetical protein
VVRAIAIGLGEVEYRVTDSAPPARPFEPGSYKYLVIPDVALRKSRLARRHLTEQGVWIDSDNGYGFAAAPPEGVIGRIVAIESLEPYDPKSLRRRLKAEGVRSVDILRKEFPHSSAEIARALGVKEGGPRKIAFTRAANRLWQITL